MLQIEISLARGNLVGSQKKGRRLHQPGPKASYRSGPEVKAHTDLEGLGGDIKVVGVTFDVDAAEIVVEVFRLD